LAAKLCFLYNLFYLTSEAREDPKTVSLVLHLSLKSHEITVPICLAEMEDIHLSTTMTNVLKGET